MAVGGGEKLEKVPESEDSASSRAKLLARSHSRGATAPDLAPCTRSVSRMLLAGALR